MDIQQKTDLEPLLRVPDSLKPRDDLVLPALTLEVVDELRAAGWSRIGILVAFVDTDGNIMMLEHNGSAKNSLGELGPLGETTQYSGPIIEQPKQTLFRGIQEELGIQYPTGLDLSAHQNGGWAINQWPGSSRHPGQIACGISFPIFLTDAVKDYLLSIPHGTEEISNIRFMPPDQIMNTPDGQLRNGVKAWLSQMQQARLLELGQYGYLGAVDFSGLYEASLQDLDLTI